MALGLSSTAATGPAKPMTSATATTRRDMMSSQLMNLFGPTRPNEPSLAQFRQPARRFGALTTNAKPARNRRVAARVALRRFNDEETCRGDDGAGRAFDCGTGAAGLSEPDH